LDTEEQIVTKQQRHPSPARSPSPKLRRDGSTDSPPTTQRQHTRPTSIRLQQPIRATSNELGSRESSFASKQPNTMTRIPSLSNKQQPTRTPSFSNKQQPRQDTTTNSATESPTLTAAQEDFQPKQKLVQINDVRSVFPTSRIPKKISSTINSFDEDGGFLRTKSASAYTSTKKDTPEPLELNRPRKLSTIEMRDDEEVAELREHKRQASLINRQRNSFPHIEIVTASTRNLNFRDVGDASSDASMFQIPQIDEGTDTQRTREANDSESTQRDSPKGSISAQTQCAKINSIFRQLV
jgi:hypothetical protein